MDKHVIFQRWLATFMKDRGLQYSKSGFKSDGLGNHAVDVNTGFWENPQYSSNKPPRWLFEIDVTGAAPKASVPGPSPFIGIGNSNTAQGDKAGLLVRILPLIKTGANTFHVAAEFEVHGLFIFHGPVSAGSSSDAFHFRPDTGDLMRSNDGEDYIFAALLGIRPRADLISVGSAGQSKAVSYGEIIDAIQAAIKITPTVQPSGQIPIFDLSTSAGVDALKDAIIDVWAEAGPAPVEDGVDKDQEESDGEPVVDYAHVDIGADPDLLGVDPSVYRQINAALKSGKRHLMFYGPPGTGKTSLARWVASNLPGGKWTLVTGSSDWSSQDVIGGYQPVGEGDVAFVPGVLLRAFDQPFIIDELNRCDIDKVIGPLFTVLSGQQTTLPYRTKIADPDSDPYVILPEPKQAPAEHEFAPGPGWRLIATINSIDKASLYQMSYALTRRFGWIYVDAPGDLRGFVAKFLEHEGVAEAADLAHPCPLADLWAVINTVRPVGPAPIIDMIRLIQAMDGEALFFAPATAAVKAAAIEAFDMVVLPMLDGVTLKDALAIAQAAAKAFGLDTLQSERVRRRLESVAI